MPRRILGPFAFLVAGVGLAYASGACGGDDESSGPTAQCEEFFRLTSDCYARAGQEFKGSAIGCHNQEALDERTLGQIQCALASREAYCNSLVAGLTRDAGALDIRDPELRKLNQCYAERTATGECRTAVQKIGECGGTYPFGPECTGPQAALAKCIIDNPVGACGLYAPREAGTQLPPETQAFQQCQVEASKVPQPEDPEEDGGF